MSKIKISINSKEKSIKINDQEINDIITDLFIDIKGTDFPTVTLKLAPVDLEINGESISYINKEKITTTYMGETAIYERSIE